MTATLQALPQRAAAVRFLLVLGVALLATLDAAAQASAAVVPGVHLPRNVVPLLYEAQLDIDPAREPFTGRIDITVRVLEPTDLVWLNAKKLAISEVRAVALAAPADEILGTVVPGSEEVVGLQFPRFLPAGEVRLSLAYAGTIDSRGGVGLFRQQEAGRWYAVSQFEPMDARRVFPCFDEPDRKAPWQLALTVPAATRAFANMPVESERSTAAGTKEIAFRRTPPLPTYLVAFAVGEFDVRDAGRAGRNNTPISVVTPKGRSAEGAFAAANAGAILAAAERYFDIPFPFPKLDLVAYPKATFGGAMENPGLITYDTRNLIARPEELSPGTEQRIFGITAHEIAHQWFGDYVTMAWWNDIWLNESFASWMGSAIVAELRPDWPRTGWRTNQRIRAMESDRLLAAGRMRQSVDRYEDVRTAFNGITYAKGEVVIGMFEQWMGHDKFRDGVRAYVKRHAWSNATADDFLAALGAADSTVIPAFRSFVERPGAPLLDVALDCSGPPTLKLSQQRFLAAGTKDPASAPWVFPACFTFGDAKKGSTACTVVREESQPFALPGAACPQWVIANRDGQGYYLPRLSPALYGALPKAERVLVPDDYAVLLGDVNLLATAGMLAMPNALSLAAREAANPDARVALRAYALAAAVPDGMLDAAGRPRYEAFVRHQLGDRARALGWLPRGGESPEVRRLRQEAVPFVADRGADTALARKAMQLATRWLEHRSAIPPEARRTVLTAAARGAGGGKDATALFDGLAAIAKSGQDANEREDVLAALGAFRDPPLRARALALALDPQVPPRSASMPLWTALQDPRNRPAALDWLDANFDAVAARVPRESQSGWIAAADGACTDAERAQFVAVFEARAAGIESGARRYSLALERIDLCLAVRRAQQPSLNAFLATVR